MIFFPSTNKIVRHDKHKTIKCSKKGVGRRKPINSHPNFAKFYAYILNPIIDLHVYKQKGIEEQKIQNYNKKHLGSKRTSQFMIVHIFSH